MALMIHFSVFSSCGELKLIRGNFWSFSLTHCANGISSFQALANHSL